MKRGEAIVFQLHVFYYMLKEQNIWNQLIKDHLQMFFFKLRQLTIRIFLSLVFIFGHGK